MTKLGYFFCGILFHFTVLKGQTDSLISKRLDSLGIHSENIINKLDKILVNSLATKELQRKYSIDSHLLAAENSKLKKQLEIEVNKNEGLSNKKLNKKMLELNSKNNLLKAEIDSLKYLIRLKNIEIQDDLKTCSFKVENATKAAIYNFYQPVLVDIEKLNFYHLVSKYTKNQVDFYLVLLPDALKAAAVFKDLSVYYGLVNLFEEGVSDDNVLQSFKAAKKLKVKYPSSKVIVGLIEFLSEYDMYYTAFFAKVNLIRDLDNKSKAYDVPAVIKLKQAEINGILFDYIYNYPQYYRYSNLSRAFNEIVELKVQNADSNFDLNISKYFLSN
jgi:hypothetical protein